MAKMIQTFGYEGLSIDQFLAVLKRSGTQVVIDVRANPLSRKPGFSKTSFRAHLEAAGIGYIHAVGVGCPKAVRDRYKVDSDWTAYTTSFLAFLKTRTKDIEAIAETALSANVCLVCFEADHELCHRSFVANAVSTQAKLKVDHLRSSAPFGSRAQAAA